MLLNDFGSRAKECLLFAERAHSNHDRDLFYAMARAWCGVREPSWIRLRPRQMQRMQEL
jgi:hypothetical protein